MLSKAKLFLLFNCSNGLLIVQTNRKSVRIAFNQYQFGMDPNESTIHCYWWPKSVKLLAHWSNEKEQTEKKNELNWKKTEDNWILKNTEAWLFLFDSTTIDSFMIKMPIALNTEYICMNAELTGTRYMVNCIQFYCTVSNKYDMCNIE